MSETRIELFDGKLQIYLRNGSRYWQCSASVGGEQKRSSTGEDNAALAKAKAEDWYLRLRGMAAAGLDQQQKKKKTEKSFGDIAKVFEAEYEIITEGQRSPKWVQGNKDRLRLHLLPFFGELGISEVTAGKVQEYRVKRMTETRKVSTPADDGEGVKVKFKPPARSTLHDEIVTLRLVLKTAIRHALLDHLPDLSPPYKTQGKVVHRPWFSPTEYKQLYEATRDYAHQLEGSFHQWDAEQLHDYVLFMTNTGLRPDEAKNLQYRDVIIVNDPASKDRILEIEVRGKRGVGYCKSTPGAVRPYERLRDRTLPVPRSQSDRARRARGEDVSKPAPTFVAKTPTPTDPVFAGNHIKMFNNLLRREKLKFDRDDNPRTAYSLRHTYICMRLMEGADIYQIAKNCRTSVEMIERFYAAHIKTTLDSTAINVMRPKQSRDKQPKVKPRGKSDDDRARPT
jgi:integrase